MRDSDLEWLGVDFAAGHEELKQVAIGLDMQILQGLQRMQFDLHFSLSLHFSYLFLGVINLLNQSFIH
jgi:hypothetical protein